MIEFEVKIDGSVRRVYKDKYGHKIHEGDIIEYPDGTKKQVYYTNDEQLGTDATNPEWIRKGLAYACEYGVFPFTDKELENITCHRSHTCCICGMKYDELGHNAEPIKHGFCCDACNTTVVIPARIDFLKSRSK